MKKKQYIAPMTERIEVDTLYMIAGSKKKGWAIDNEDHDPNNIIDIEEDGTGDNEFLDLD